MTTFWYQYEDLEESLKNLENIKFFEKTSGSSGKQKLIPYNQDLLNSFEFAFRVWIYDLLSSGLNLETGRIFLSISSTTSNYDLGYLNGFLQWILKSFIVEINDFENLQDSIREALISEKDLEVISIWSPTYLLSALEKTENLSPEKTKSLWPKLKLISCWMDGNSQLSANKLKQIFQHCQFQGKGLLATEAPITIPIKTLNNQCIPLITEVFMEFIDKTNQIHLIGELEINEVYELIITNKAGLYRYKLGDFVRVSGFYKNTPCLEFIGRSSSISDYVGEKLSEEFIRAFLLELLGGNAHQSFLSISHEENKYKYILYLDDSIKKALNERLTDEKLCEYYHYGLARKHGQLEQLQIRKIPNLIQKKNDFLCKEQNTTIGNLKDTQLISDLQISTKIKAYLQNLE